MAEPLEIFFSYTHADEAWRKKIETSLSTLKRQNLIKGWSDRNIFAGNEWEEMINSHLQSAPIILLLISPDFINSDYCYSEELDQAIKLHQAGRARVIPIILRPTDWKGTPFARLQALPREGKPISRWADTDEALLEVAKGIRRVVEDMQKTSQALPANQKQPLPPSTGISASQTASVSLDRIALLERLSTCPPAIFDTTTFLIDLPPGVLSSGNTSQAQRAIELIKWATYSDGPGLDALRNCYLQAIKRI
jgi:TIR domain